MAINRTALGSKLKEVETISGLNYEWVAIQSLVYQALSPKCKKVYNYLYDSKEWRNVETISIILNYPVLSTKRYVHDMFRLNLLKTDTPLLENTSKFKAIKPRGNNGNLNVS